MRLFFLFLIIASTTFSQSKTAKGVIFGQSTNQPIPYVNLTILESNVGTSSNEDGSFQLLIEEKDVSKKVHLSSLGYKDSIIPVEQLLRENKIYLAPKSEELDEVIISSIKSTKIKVVNEINENDLCAGYSSDSDKPWMLALYFPYKEIYEETEFLKEVKFYFGNFKNKKCKFRLRIFSLDENGMPGQDLLLEEVIVNLKNKQKDIVVEIEKFNIPFPKIGMYVALEWLYVPYNEQKVTYCLDKKCKSKKEGIRNLPIFSATCEDEYKNKVVAFSSGKWIIGSSTKHNSDKKLIPAISLTLSN